MITVGRLPLQIWLRWLPSCTWLMHVRGPQCELHAYPLLSAFVGRSIKAGLTACDIVSKWTWAATLLQVGGRLVSLGAPRCTVWVLAPGVVSCFFSCAVPNTRSSPP